MRVGAAAESCMHAERRVNMEPMTHNVLSWAGYACGLLAVKNTATVVRTAA